MLVLLLLYGVRKYREGGVQGLDGYVYMCSCLLCLYIGGVWLWATFMVCWTWIGLYLKGRNASVLLLNITV